MFHRSYIFKSGYTEQYINQPIVLIFNIINLTKNLKVMI